MQAACTANIFLAFLRLASGLVEGYQKIMSEDKTYTLPEAASAYLARIGAKGGRNGKRKDKVRAAKIRWAKRANGK